MAVLIKGIDMPQNCEECPFKIRLGWENRIVMACKFMASIELVDQSTRAEDCPLTEVPPHVINFDKPYTFTISWDGKQLKGNMCGSGVE